MATLLHKPVSRVTKGNHLGRQLVVCLEPPDLISLRQKGRRTSYTIPIAAAYDLAAKIYARQEKQRKIEERKGKKLITPFEIEGS